MKRKPPKNPPPPPGLTWLPSSDRRFTMRGLAWYEENGRSFERWPKRAEKIVRGAVWSLGCCPAGARLCFRTDATTLVLRARNAAPDGMNHMPASGQGGCALFAGGPFQRRPWTIAIPNSGKPDYERILFQDLPREMRELTLYLPLYNRLESLELGINKGARILPPAPLALPKPVVFYGTSITQGGCAAVPGTDFVATVGRQLEVDAVNLGFSGNGKGEPEVAELIAEIDAALYVLDYCANTDTRRFQRTLPAFHAILRRRRPQTPIIVTSQLCYGRTQWNGAAREQIEGKRDAAMRFHLRARAAGDRNLHFIDGFGLLPHNGVGITVDSCHPTTHGFQIIAERLAPQIEYVLTSGK